MNICFRCLGCVCLGLNHVQALLHSFFPSVTFNVECSSSGPHPFASVVSGPNNNGSNNESVEVNFSIHVKNTKNNKNISNRNSASSMNSNSNNNNNASTASSASSTSNSNDTDAHDKAGLGNVFKQFFKWVPIPFYPKN